MKPSIPQVLSRFTDYLEKNLAWGSLHIVLSDNNVDDDSVRFCINYAEEKGDQEGKELAEILLTMSKTQRLRLPVKAWDMYLHRRSMP